MKSLAKCTEPALSSVAPAMNMAGLPSVVCMATGHPDDIPADSLPEINSVSPQFCQKNILAGKHVNLATLIMTGYRGPRKYEQSSPTICKKNNSPKATQWSMHQQSPHHL